PQSTEAVATCDPARLRQVLRNLLTNAERYGGPNVAIFVDVEGDFVVVDVVDDGAGIPRRDWDRIFEPYQRAHDAPGQPDSVGVGLAISRQLATLMGGSLDYRYSDRSVFRLRLPVARRVGTSDEQGVSPTSVRVVPVGTIAITTTWRRHGTLRTPPSLQRLRGARHRHGSPVLRRAAR